MSIGPVAGGPEQLDKEMRSVASRLPGDKLAILYLPEDVNHIAYLRAAQEGLGGPVVGATTGGAAFTERGVTRDQPVAAVIGGAGVDFKVGVAMGLDTNPVANIAAGVRPIVEAARGYANRNHALITLADPFACDGESLLSAVADAVPPHWRLFGGTAGDGWNFSGVKLFAQGEVFDNAAVMIGLFSDAAPSLATRHGWCAAEGSEELTVTRMEGNRLITLNDQPAAAVYSGELTRLGLMSSDDEPMSAMAKHELGAKTVFGNELKIRAPLGVDDDGSVRLASSLPVGTLVRVVTADPDRLIGAATELSRRALHPFQGAAVRGALVFDCAARLQLLGDRYDEQVAAFMGGRNFPMVGMACYGEIARFGGSIEGFHNTTAVMAAW
ncbi:MAG: FIST C-terminal domain-containing protein [Deltaproteobacteria bacterium]|nr:FIST C-terminal domain-containing protein [Deltaproteobacteria bacterium]